MAYPEEKQQPGLLPGLLMGLPVALLFAGVVLVLSPIGIVLAVISGALTNITLRLARLINPALAGLRTGFSLTFNVVAALVILVAFSTGRTASLPAVLAWIVSVILTMVLLKDEILLEQARRLFPNLDIPEAPTPEEEA